MVSTCDLEVQKARVLARPGVSEGKFQAILARQVPDAEKRRRAEFVINIKCSVDETEERV